MSTCKRMWTEREVRALGVDATEQKPNLKVFENIVDKDGHPRFIDGDITMETIEGVTQNYGKWSLSGSHLMIVVAASVVNGTALTSGDWVKDIDLPQWIKDKIVPLYSTTNVAFYTASARAANMSSQNFTFVLQKSSGKISLYCVTNETLTADRGLRVQIDLIIDND